MKSCHNLFSVIVVGWNLTNCLFLVCAKRSLLQFVLGLMRGMRIIDTAQKP